MLTEQANHHFRYYYKSIPGYDFLARVLLLLIRKQKSFLIANIECSKTWAVSILAQVFKVTRVEGRKGS
ncbi:MAG TPA: hypothetical protein DHV55_04295 [Clostridiaceae bacterium]|nr:hypothetical protein [Clostridiaceae bacterium]